MNDPRIKPNWNPHRWRDSHPLGIEAFGRRNRGLPLSAGYGIKAR
jgi:hypothetical protein